MTAVWTRRPDGRRRAWASVIGGSCVQVLISAALTQSYGGYVVTIRQETGWSNTTLASGYALLRLESNLLGPVQGWITDRWGPRRVMTWGIVMLGIGFMLFSRIQTPTQFFAAFVVMAVGTSFAGWTTLAVSIVRMFRTGRSLPMSVAKFGMGLGGLASPLVLGMMAVYGWRTTAFATGVAILVLGVPVTRLIEGGGRHVPQPALPAAEVALPDESPVDAVVATPPEVSFSVREALRTRAFWMLSLVHSCAVMVVAALLVHLVPFLTTTLDYSLGAASIVVAGLTAAQMAGTVVGGVLGDRLNRRRILATTMFMHGGGLLVLTYAVDVWMVVLFVLAHGLAWGIRAPLQQSLRADYFGAASFGAILGFSSLLVMIGNSGGPVLEGFTVDQTGSYRPGFTLMALIAICGSAFFLLARPPHQLHPAGQPGPADDHPEEMRTP